MFKVCILAAGLGSRNESSEYFNKALLPIENRAAISIIMDKFPKDTSFIIAVGHHGDILEDYLNIAEKDRNIKIVKIKNYMGKGSGPGLSLLKCKHLLKCPFIFTSCDTIIQSKIDTVNQDWVGTSIVNDPKRFLTFKCSKNKVIGLNDKVTITNLLNCGFKPPYEAFAGIAGIKNYKEFWNSLENNKNLIHNELQVSNGLHGLINKGLVIKKLNWEDIGTEVSYQNVLNKRDIRVLPKLSETIFFEKKKVFKFFANKFIATNRYKRSKLIKEALPENISLRNNFLYYNYQDGSLLSDQTDRSVFEDFLNFSKNTIWQERKLNKNMKNEFLQESVNFYKNKTINRVKLYFKKNNVKDDEQIINGINIPKILTALEYFDWENFYSFLKPVKFHGDPQPENIIVTKDYRFIYLDWRETYGNKLLFGDIYYDFGKIYHALIVSGKVIRNNQFNIIKSGKRINLEFLVRENLLRFLKAFEDFISNQGYNIQHVRIMSGIIFLNIAALHHSPYDKFVFNYGRFILENATNKKWTL